MPRPTGQNHGETAQWLNQNVDSRYSPAQWEAWVAEGGYDSACPDDAPFRSAREGAGGACVAKPVDCPEGQFLHGNRCYGEGETPGGFGLGGYQGAGAAGGAAPRAAPRALTLQDLLIDMFSGRKSAFGLQAGRDPFASQFQGTFGVDQYGAPLPQAPELTSKPLAGGGIIWAPAGTDLTAFGAGAPLTAASTAATSPGMVSPSPGLSAQPPAPQPIGLFPPQGGILPPRSIEDLFAVPGGRDALMPWF